MPTETGRKEAWADYVARVTFMKPRLWVLLSLFLDDGDRIRAAALACSTGGVDKKHGYCRRRNGAGSSDEDPGDLDGRRADYLDRRIDDLAARHHARLDQGSRMLLRRTANRGLQTLTDTS